MNRKKYIAVFLITILCVAGNLFSDDNSFQWKMGEELTYKVKWSFIKLGELKLTVLNKDTMNDRPPTDAG